MKAFRFFLTLFVLAIGVGTTLAQPAMTPSGVRFDYANPDAKSVAVAGSFNGWSIAANPLKMYPDGRWSAVVDIAPGQYQYKFVVDGSNWLRDPANPAFADDQRGGANSAFAVNDQHQVELRAPVKDTEPVTNPKDEYEPGPTIYLNMIWHQHQPLYLNPERDWLEGPWVRTHSTKDYYDMAAVLEQYSDVHVTINLTTVLLQQLQFYYIDRIRPYADPVTMSIDTIAFFARWEGKTDPWIDLALRPVSSYSKEDLDRIYTNAWSCFAVSDVMINRWPEYKALRDKPVSKLTPSDLTALKGFFYLAMFDPDFLRGAVQLPTGVRIDLSDLVKMEGDPGNPTYRLRKPIDDAICNRLVASSVFVMEAIIPEHRKLQYDPDTHKGQIEIITTPYYHPILPLLMNSDIARRCQPTDSLPVRFSAPADAAAQVAASVSAYERWFGMKPRGFWPGEGSVAPEVLPIFAKYGIQWTASDRQVLAKSDPPNQPWVKMYAAGETVNPVALVFRDTDLSDRLGFRYQQWDPEAAAEDFVQGILSYAKVAQEPYLTVILDGENAWEHYTKDNDGKRTIRAIYRKLMKLYSLKRVITATPSEYIAGNPGRNVPAHPVDRLPRLNRLHSGSWIYANYDTWIGEQEENDAWTMLGKVRADLVATGIAAPDLSAPMPKENSVEFYQRRAWESLYAAEGSDWFWWYGTDQNAPGGADLMFDNGYRVLLQNVYRYAKLAGAKVDVPIIPSFIRTAPSSTGGGVMQPGSK